MPQFVRNDNWDALIAVLEAVRIERTRQRHIFVSQSDRPGLREALEARFLKELMERFPKVVKRAAGFDWLPFSDPQLREAIRCYLYGFFRAAILVAVAALESRLKKIGLPPLNRSRSSVRILGGRRRQDAHKAVEHGTDCQQAAAGRGGAAPRSAHAPGL